MSHLCTNDKSYKKLFKQGLGAGTSCYFTVDPSRQPGEPGGIAVIVGPKWGTSLLHEQSRTDRSGHGVLTRVRLRTASGFLSIYGTYWPYKPDPSTKSEGSKKLWNRVHSFCQSDFLQDPDPLLFIQSLIDQWMAGDWEDRADGLVLAGDFNSRWLPGDHGGQRSLSTWADERFVINGPRLIANRGQIEFHTFGRMPTPS